MSEYQTFLSKIWLMRCVKEAVISELILSANTDKRWGSKQIFLLQKVYIKKPPLIALIGLAVIHRNTKGNAASI